jgi:hypothetical protein
VPANPRSVPNSLVKGIKFDNVTFTYPGGTEPVIYDSRFGIPIEHGLSKINYQILEFLNKPRRFTDIAARMSSIPGFNIESDITLLNEKGLIFQEDERYMSIVRNPGIVNTKSGRSVLPRVW